MDEKIKRDPALILFSKTIAIGAFSLLILGASCPDPMLRPGTAFNGSAKWAFNIAQPLITDFASDVELYVIGGTRIWKDGRLPSNTGTWTFFAWSASRQQELQVTVYHDENTRTKLKDEEEPPGRGQPIPTNWANSTTIFQAAWPYVSGAPSSVTLVIFNFTEYPEAPGQAVWGLVYESPGGTHKVRWDGVYLETT